MYPVPRMLIAAAFFLAVGYGIVALVFLSPAREGLIAYLFGLPVLAGIGIAIFARGEPGDQKPVHEPRLSEAEFEALEDRVDQLASTDTGAMAHAAHPRRGGRFDPARNEQDFQELVRQAIDELPPEFAHALDHVGVVVSDQGAVQRINGRRQPLYGLYIGHGGRSAYIIGAPAGGALPDRIVIFRDTLVHDYGNDPTRLRAAVTRTLRHELAHHLGWDEEGVRKLGL
ncbi:MAG: metallopeptidase family protein [Solirubrobacteraceae bacterium]